MVTIKSIINALNEIQKIDPRLNSFGSGPLYDLEHDMRYYPYLFVINDLEHDVLYTDNNKYRSIEYNFILRVGDKVNNQKNVYQAYGDNSNNGLEILSDTFEILIDVINAISENSLG
jgi:hypothetical protein